MTSPTWHSDDVPPHRRPTTAGWVLVALRAIACAVILTTGVATMAALRIIERPLNGPRRPWSPYITQTVCRLILRVIGLRRRFQGLPSLTAGTIVANHSSWLDILVLNAGQRVTFVAKSEVAGWPGIGLLARITGTMFVQRTRRAAAQQVANLKQAIAAGHQIVLFAEGTSTDGRRVLPFKPTLFAALTDVALQPVSIAYTAPQDRDPRFYGWWGGMDLGPHLLDVMATWRQGRVDVTYHPTHVPQDGDTRKTLATQLEITVRDGVTSSLERRS